MREKISVIRAIPSPVPVGRIYVQAVGCYIEDAKHMVTKTTTHAHIPEPLRVAHIIASGIVRGESKGRA